MPETLTRLSRVTCAAALGLALLSGTALAQPQNPTAPEATVPGTPPAATKPVPAPAPGGSPRPAATPGTTATPQGANKDAAEKPAAQLPDDDVVNDTTLVLACKQKALVLIRQKSPSVEDIFIDMDGLTVAKADTMVGNTKVVGVMMGEAYIQRDQTDNIHRFLCLTGEGGKVLMTFFTER
ncbi:hypothetical protein GCM10007301_06570 [Azorhizobium oxalatiphilum]|uniref:Uncharacterized protein n=1 Tax=Azorhizobium oxalatiphilum TaxID=980631 RepID=A0A917BM68_9HYPH|nr:hypothetical protein [Azorhizobium oxalatiphilum]GGF50003.1 hypothetical protein GCM10007301_06570 [Azorhizobium oxalatiphilum]